MSGASAAVAGLADHYDAVVIGAGHNGLCLALYLTRCGKRTLVLEKASSVGGLAVTDGNLLPGFRHHRHANYLSYLDLRNDELIDFEALGVEMAWPEAQHGICFRGDRPPLILYRPDRAELTRRSIARYSAKDARNYLRAKSRADRLGRSLARIFYAPPSRRRLDRQRREVAAAFSPWRFSVPLGNSSARDVIDSLFETAELRALLYRLTLEFGGSLSDTGSDIAFLGYVLWMVGRRRLPIGGMSTVPSRLRATAEELGGSVCCDAGVREIVVEDGRAAGVVLEDGRRIWSKTIAIATPIAELYGGLLAPTLLTNDRRAALARFQAANAPSVGSSAFCLREPPNYRSAAIEPDINRCMMTFIGLDTPAEVLEAAADVASGCLPAPNAAVRVNTLWDSSQAPPGYHSAGADTLFPSTATLGPETVGGLAESFAPALLDIWADYAPNMIDANALSGRFVLSSDSERKLLIVDGADQYRAGVSGVYLCGAETYPGGGVHGACAFNAAQVMLQDAAVDAEGG